MTSGSPSPSRSATVDVERLHVAVADAHVVDDGGAVAHDAQPDAAVLIAARLQPRQGGRGAPGLRGVVVGGCRVRREGEREKGGDAHSRGEESGHGGATRTPPRRHSTIGEGEIRSGNPKGSPQGALDGYHAAARSEERTPPDVPCKSLPPFHHPRRLSESGPSGARRWRRTRSPHVGPQHRSTSRPRSCRTWRCRSAMYCAARRLLPARRWPGAIPAAGFLLRTYIVFHDCTHGSFLPSKRANALARHRPRAARLHAVLQLAPRATRSTTRPPATSTGAASATCRR